LYIERLNRSSLLYTVHQGLALSSPAEQAPHILRLAAKREILSPNGICSDLAHIHKSITLGIVAPDSRLDDPTYQALVAQVVSKGQEYAHLLQQESFADVLSYIQITALSSACSQVLEAEGYESEEELDEDSLTFSADEASYDSEEEDSAEYPLEERVCECAFCSEIREFEQQWSAWEPQSALERILWNSVNVRA
jgi:hypothetical protein